MSPGPGLLLTLAVAVSTAACVLAFVAAAQTTDEELVSDLGLSPEAAESTLRQFKQFKVGTA